MKNLTRLLVAVVALAAVSCATDATQDLGVNLSEKTTLNLSWEKVRTQLGEKVDGAYPLYWSEGDQISVNGVASEPLTEEQSGKSSATFTVEGEFASFNVAYPAAEEGQVLFAEKQAHLNNDTFASGVTTVYGVGTTASDVALHYLTGFVKFGVTGSATLTKIEVAADNECALAGAFNIDFATGEVTPTEGASKVIEYSFGEGATLSEEPLYVHIAVPAGDYAKLVVTLYDSENGSTTRQINGGDIVAGKLLEMSTNVEYVADEVFDGLVIDSAEKLVELAANASAYSKVRVTADIDMSEVEWAPIEGFAGEFDGGNYTISGLKAPLFGTTVATSIKNVKLAVAINNYSGAFFGALACVMTNTEAVVENCSVSGTITFGNIVAESGIDVYLAGLVGKSASKVELTGLTSSANIELVGENYTNTIIVSGVVVSHLGALSNVTNTGNLTFSGKQTTGALRMAGVCAYPDGNLTNCVNGSADNKHNAGNITINGEGNTSQWIVLSGVAISIDGTETIELNGCNNYGDIAVNRGGETITGARIAGIMDYCSVDNTALSNCENYGHITVAATTTTTSTSTYYGGIISQHNKSTTLTNVHNYGDITLTDKYSSGGNVHFAGINGRWINSSSYTHTLTNCSNNGKLTFNGELTSKSYSLFIGGIYSRVNSAAAFNMTNCENGENGTISFGGTIATYGQIGGVVGECKKLTTATNVGNRAAINYSGTANYSSTTEHGVGGVIGNATVAMPAEASIYNYGAIDCSEATVSKTEKFHCGGLVGVSTKSIAGGTVFCNISSGEYAAGMVTGATKALGASASNCNIGGEINGTTLAFENYHKYITSLTSDYSSSELELAKLGYLASKDAQPEYPEAVGCEIASTDDLLAFAAAVADGTAESSYTVVANLDMSNVDWTPINGFAGAFNGGAKNGYKISGLKAPLFGTTQAASIKNVNLVNVNIEYDATGKSNFGALARKIDNSSAEVENCSVSGTIVLNNDESTDGTGDRYHAGLIGDSTSTKEFKNLSSSANLTIKIAYQTGYVYIGGVMAKHSGALTNATHTGNITFNGKQTKNGNTEIAGVCHNVEGNVTNCVNGDATDKHNAGNILVQNAEVVAGHYSMIAGVVYKTDATTISGCYNYGDLTVADTGKSYKGIRISGIFDQSATLGLAVTNCENHGKLTASATLTSSVNCYGGITANKLSTASYTNVHNYGDITLTAEHSSSYNTYVGGLLGGCISNGSYAFSLENCSNNGKLTFSGVQTDTANSRFLELGGLVAAVQAASEFNMTNCHNYGEILIGGTTSGIIRAGGVFGDCRKLVAKNVGNNAKITCTTAFTYSGAASHGIGGFVGFLYNFDLGTAEGENYYNYGDINMSGATFTKSDSFHVGGVVAYADAAKGDCVNNATAVCNITAIGLKPGMIVGVPYSANVTLGNCKAGGTICRVEEGYNDPFTGQYEFGPKIEELTAHNLQNYVYSEGTSTDNVAGVTYQAPAN